MDRRSYLTGSASVTAALLAGCSALTGSSNSSENSTTAPPMTGVNGTQGGRSGNSNSDSDSATEQDTRTRTATATPTPPAITGIKFDGTEMNVQLRADAGVKRLDFLNPAGENVGSKSVRSATQVSFSLVKPTGEDPIQSIKKPGTYTVVAVPQAETRSSNTATGSLEQRVSNAGPNSGPSNNATGGATIIENERRKVELQPEVSIAEIRATSAMDSPPEASSVKSESLGSLAIKVSNTGTVPTWISNTRVFGANLPTTRTNQNIGKSLSGPKGSALKWYNRSVNRSYANRINRTALPIGDYWYWTDYIPLAINADQYDSYIADELKKDARRDYFGKTAMGTFALSTTDGTHLAAPFKVLFMGNDRYFSRMASPNVVEFTDVQVAFDPAVSVSGKNATNPARQFGENALANASFPANETGNVPTTIAGTTNATGTSPGMNTTGPSSSTATTGSTSTSGSSGSVFGTSSTSTRSTERASALSSVLDFLG